VTRLPDPAAAPGHTKTVRNSLAVLLAACGTLGAAPAARAGAPPAAVGPAAVAPAAAVHVAPLAEPEVRAFMTRIENAARARDVAALGAALAEDCRVELRTRLEGREHLTVLTRARYVELLQNGYAAFKDLERYDYALEDVRVTLAADGSATVVSRVTETLVLNGERTVTASEETSRIERRGGELKLVAVSALTLGR